MKKYKISLMIAVAALMVACATNPFTGKKTMAIVPK